MEPATIAFLVVAGFIAAFIDSIVGGGGIISLPALLAAGLPPHVALGTNKLCGTGASSMATLQYLRHGLIRRRVVLALLPFSLAGSLLGAATVLQVDARFIRPLVIAIMIAMTGWVLARPRFGEAATPRTRQGLVVVAGAAMAGVVGFYDGFLGPGTGSFLLFGFVAINGYAFLDAAAHGRVLNFASNIAALGFFVAADSIDYAAGLPMMVAMMAGGTAGSQFAIRHGRRWVRVLFVAVTAALLLRLLVGS